MCHIQSGIATIMNNPPINMSCSFLNPSFTVSTISHGTTTITNNIYEIIKRALMHSCHEQKFEQLFLHIVVVAGVQLFSI